MWLKVYSEMFILLVCQQPYKLEQLFLHAYKKITPTSKLEDNNKILIQICDW